MSTTPIEFMAWSKRYKRMVDDYILIKLNKQYIEYMDLELMQRTALRSINDEPIYNHMIVKDQLRTYHIVDMHNYWVMWSLSKYELTIVGNRFQNPELLEMCK